MRKRIFWLLCVTLWLMLLAPAVFAAEQVRIALVRGQNAAELNAAQAFSVRGVEGSLRLPAGKYILRVENGALLLEGRSEDEQEGKQEARSWRFASAIELTGEGKTMPCLNQRVYRGVLRAQLADDGCLLVVNRLPLEDYLASVLPAKTMVVWPDEAIKAQAVAARSYALYYMRRQQGASYDLTAMDEELRYEGTGERVEKANITRLIRATAGEYLMDAAGQPILAVTTSSSGGRTEAAADAWGRDLAYLRSVEDYDSDSPDYTWEYRATPALLEGQLAQRGYVVGKLNSVRLSPLDAPDADRTATGRVRYVVLSGAAGTARLSGRELAELVGLKSTLFDLETGTPPPDKLRVPVEDRYGYEVGSKDIDIKLREDGKPVWSTLLRSYHMLSGAKEEKLIFRGRGSGSGLGLSAWGARGMVNADERLTYRELLAHYYPGTHITR